MNDRLQIAAMCLQGILANPDLNLHSTPSQNAKFATSCTDALLAEIGELSSDEELAQAYQIGRKQGWIDATKEYAQPSKVEVTVVERLLEDLLVTIDDFGEKEHIEDLRETDAMQCALEYVKAKYSAINGDDQ